MVNGNRVLVASLCAVLVLYGGIIALILPPAGVSAAKAGTTMRGIR